MVLWQGKFTSFSIYLISFLYSLVATIKKARPDLLPNWSIQADPIPEEIPDHILNEGKIEDIGRPITPCFLVSSAIDPTGWYAKVTCLGGWVYLLTFMPHLLIGGCLRNMMA